MTKNTKDALLGGALITCLIILLAMIFMITNGKLGFHNKTTLEKTTVQTERIYDLNDPFTEAKVRRYLVQLNVKYPDVALAQMKLESANGTSKVFREGNNLFGMKKAERRPTTAMGEKNNHAYYSHWRQSCIDYALWQAFVANPENISSERAWLYYIGRIYAVDDAYHQKLLVVRRNLKVNQT